MTSMQQPAGTPTLSAMQRLQAFWDERYSSDEFAYGTAPNGFLVQMAARIRSGGRVLCLAEGEGRNSVWLAQRGMQVTAVDVSGRGLRKAQEFARQAQVTIETVLADVTRFDLGVDRWDAIVSIFLHLPPKTRRALHDRCLAALKAGGVFIYEAYGHEQLRYGTGGPKEPELLPTFEDVLDELRGFRIEHRFAGTREVQEGRLHNGPGYVVQMVAAKEQM
jgi:SAM-dependent methyltransferase